MFHVVMSNHGDSICFFDKFKEPVMNKIKMNCLQPVYMRINFTEDVNKTY